MNWVRIVMYLLFLIMIVVAGTHMDKLLSITAIIILYYLSSIEERLNEIRKQNEEESSENQ